MEPIDHVPVAMECEGEVVGHRREEREEEFPVAVSSLFKRLTFFCSL